MVQLIPADHFSSSQNIHTAAPRICIVQKRPELDFLPLLDSLSGARWAFSYVGRPTQQMSRTRQAGLTVSNGLLCEASWAL
jgi:hypothetical protein